MSAPAGAGGADADAGASAGPAFSLRARRLDDGPGITVDAADFSARRAMGLIAATAPNVWHPRFTAHQISTSIDCSHSRLYCLFLVLIPIVQIKVGTIPGRGYARS